jgi:hypothetical protein
VSRHVVGRVSNPKAGGDVGLQVQFFKGSSNRDPGRGRREVRVVELRSARLGLSVPGHLEDAAVTDAQDHPRSSPAGPRAPPPSPNSCLIESCPRAQPAIGRRLTRPRSDGSREPGCHEGRTAGLCGVSTERAREACVLARPVSSIAGMAVYAVA